MASKAENKTKPTSVNVDEFIANVENDTRRQDSLRVMEMMRQITGEEPKMWGPSIIGFGQYHYKYDSGHEGDMAIVGFSPRKANLVVYIMPGYVDYSEKLARLGKHKIGKSCLYINKLADIDESVLKELITESVAYMRANYSTK
jgi:hypothetical protein